MRRFILAASVALASLAVSAGPALADTCLNVSRAAPTGPVTGPLVEGNWLWLPSVGAPIQAWAFIPPGTDVSVFFDLPGANGNFTNGKTDSLLGVSANCPPGANPNRQTTNGIQSGCGER